MVGNTDRVSRGTLDHITGKAAMFTLVTPMFIGLMTGMGIDAGTGYTEASGGGYARVSMAAVAWNSASGSAPSITSNASNCTFPISTASWSSGANLIGFGLFDSSTSGGTNNLLNHDYIGPGLWLPFTASLASPGVINCPGHGFANGDLVAVTAEFGGTLPTGFTASTGSTLYTVAGVSGDTFNVGVNTTTTGNGFIRKVVPLSVNSANITPSVAAGSLILTNG